jgi:hypothetical protein
VAGFQPWHYWHWGQIILVVENVLCIAECIAASLALPTQCQ